MASNRFNRTLIPFVVFFVVLSLAGAAGLLTLRIDDGPATQTGVMRQTTPEDQVKRMVEEVVSALNDPDAMSSTVNSAMLGAARAAPGQVAARFKGASGEAEAEAPAQGESERIVESNHDTLCKLVERAAASYGLPTDFFSRLLWQESSFRAEAVSPVGALGIAQFMPVTAAERGLENPLDPHQAIPASADFLGELVERFGNLGLAAAAYNAGPRRVWEWIAGTGGMPQETRHYVAKITGKPVEYWRDQLAAAGQAKEEQPLARPCAEVVAELASPEPAETVQALQAPSVQQLASTRALTAEPEPLSEAASKEVVASETPDEEPAPSETELALAVPGPDAEPQKAPDSTSEPNAAAQPWGVQIAADHSEAKALSSYRAVQEQHPDILASEEPLILRQRNPGMGTREMVNVRVAMSTREAADELCDRLRGDGGACAVLKN